MGYNDTVSLYWFCGQIELARYRAEIQIAWLVSSIGYCAECGYTANIIRELKMHTNTQTQIHNNQYDTGHVRGAVTICCSHPFLGTVIPTIQTLH